MPLRRFLHALLKAAPTYCGECGWWVENCPHQT